MANFVTGTKGTNRDIVPQCPPGHQGDKSGHPPLGGVPFVPPPLLTPTPNFAHLRISCLSPDDQGALQTSEGPPQGPLVANTRSIPRFWKQKAGGGATLWKASFAGALEVRNSIANPRIPRARKREARSIVKTSTFIRGLAK